MTPDETSFLKDVAAHRMAVLHDQAESRHLQFRRPGTYCMGFDIVTWPGYLAYTGDMGCYVFTRLRDMFEFFRTDRAYAEKHGSGRKLHINLAYWAEKCVAQDRDGIRVYSPEAFMAAVRRWTENWDATDRQHIESNLIPRAHDGEHEAVRAALAFDKRLQDFYEADVREYSYRFRWCCYALAWGIQQYDNAKVPA